MLNHPDQPLAASQLRVLERAFRHGAADASGALSEWLGRPCLLNIQGLEMIPFEQATTLLGDPDQPICLGAMALTGVLTGQLILAFEKGSGLALADLLLDQPPGSSTDWGEMELSAALETTNIVGCAYLNSLARELFPGQPGTELLPTPPSFYQDFAASLMQSVLMSQAMASDQVLLAQSAFTIDGRPVSWTLLWVPDAETMQRLAELLPEGD